MKFELIGRYAFLCYTWNVVCSMFSSLSCWQFRWLMFLLYSVCHVIILKIDFLIYLNTMCLVVSNLMLFTFPKKKKKNKPITQENE